MRGYRSRRTACVAPAALHLIRAAELFTSLEADYFADTAIIDGGAKMQMIRCDGAFLNAIPLITRQRAPSGIGPRGWLVAPPRRSSNQRDERAAAAAFAT